MEKVEVDLNGAERFELLTNLSQLIEIKKERDLETRNIEKIRES